MCVSPGSSQFTCFIRTKVRILTEKSAKIGQIDKGKTQADVGWMKPRAAKVAQELQEAIAAIEAQRQQDLAVLTGKLGNSARLLYWYKSTQMYAKVPHRQARYLSSLALLVQKYTNVHNTKVHESTRTDAEGAWMRQRTTSRRSTPRIRRSMRARRPRLRAQCRRWR